MDWLGRLDARWGRRGTILLIPLGPDWVAVFNMALIHAAGRAGHVYSYAVERVFLRSVSLSTQLLNKSAIRVLPFGGPGAVLAGAGAGRGGGVPAPAGGGALTGAGGGMLRVRSSTSPPTQ